MENKLTITEWKSLLDVINGYKRFRQFLSDSADPNSGELVGLFNKVQAHVKHLESEIPLEVEAPPDYCDSAKVNGIKIAVGRPYSAKGNDRYFEIYFPDVETNYELGPFDQVIQIGDDPNEARDVFKRATKLASKAQDVYEVFRGTSDFINNIN